MGIDEIHAIGNAPDSILHDHQNLDWPEIVEMEVENEDVWCGVVIPNSVKREIITMLENKTKLMAVKYLKDATGLGLRDAKEYCDNLEDSLSL